MNSPSLGLQIFRIKLALLLAAGVCVAQSDPTIYRKRPKADFDDVLKILDGQGKWMKQEQLLWVFEPEDQSPPLIRGQWVYTDYGWYYKGQRPIDEITNHYGVWINQQGKWRWHPSSTWRAHSVEFRGTNTHIGWRPTVLNTDGSIMEPETSRFAIPGTWVWVPREKFGKPMTQADEVVGEKSVELLDDSRELKHTYHAWQPISRSGPDPYLVYGVDPPQQDEQETAGEVDPFLAASGLDAVEDEAVAPPIPGMEDDGYRPDTKVPKLIVMNLTKWDEKPPAAAARNHLYAFRPEFYQVESGLFRRIDRWMNPDSIKKRTSDIVANALVREGGPRVFDGSQNIGGLATYDPNKTPAAPKAQPVKPALPVQGATTSNSQVITTGSSALGQGSLSPPPAPVESTTNTPENKQASTGSRKREPPPSRDLRSSSSSKRTYTRAIEP